MPEFEYRAKEGPQKIVTGTLDASSEEAAIEKLSQMGYVPLSIRERTSLAGQALSFELLRSSGYRNRKVIGFSRHLASLIQSGVPILKAVQILLDHEKDRGFLEILRSIHKGVKGGKSLSESIGSFRKTFVPVFVSMVRAGEATGSLPEALLKIAEYLKKQERLRTRVKQALAYPIILSLVGAATVFFILTFVVPELTTLFDRMGQDLPLPTKMIVGLGDFMSRFWVLVLAFVLILGYVIPKFFRQYLGKAFLDEWVLKIPVLGLLILKTEISRFSKTMAMALGNGISFVEALTVALPTFENEKLRHDLEECKLEVQKGERFGNCITERGNFPDLVTNMIQVGEESGSLDGVLNDIADVYEQESDEQIQTFTTILEPVTILIVGVIVGFIVIAMLLPVFEMNVGL